MTKQRDELNVVFDCIINEYRACISKVAKKYNLYVGQTEVLFLLDAKTNRSQKELAGELGVSKATIGVSLRRMESAGLINRVTDSKDARCIRVSLTSKGLDVCNKCKKAYSDIYSSMFGSMTEKRRKDALDILGKMGKSLVAVKKKL